jgi:hypothetical protein
MGDEPQQAGPGGGKIATDKWAPCQIFSKMKIKHPKLNSPRKNRLVVRKILRKFVDKEGVI